ncbi:MAG: hypothetical protein ABIA04_08000 [Pseudomonadota bacterium]
MKLINKLKLINIILLCSAILLLISSCFEDENYCTPVNSNDDTYSYTCPDGVTETIDLSTYIEAGIPGISVPTNTYGYQEGTTWVGSYTLETLEDNNYVASLTKITGSLVINTTTLSGIENGSIEEIGGSFILPFAQTSITSLSFLNLKTVGGDINLSFQNSLESVNFPKLSSANTLSIGDNLALTTITTPLLTSLANLYLIEDVAFTSLSISSLTTITNNISIFYTTTLEEINFPSLTYVGSEIFIVENEGLINLEMPKLAHGPAERFFICWNFELPNCDVKNIIDQLNNNDWNQPYSYDNKWDGC